MNTKNLGYLLLVGFILMGSFVPLAVYSVSYVNPSDLVPPGVDLQETPLKDSVSNESDGTMYTINFTRMSDNPYTISGNFCNSDLITYDQAVPLSLNYIGNLLAEYLDDIPTIEHTFLFGVPTLKLDFHPTNASTSFEGISLNLNIYSGKVVQYTINWRGSILNLTTMLDIDRNNNGILNQSEALDKLAEFLTIHSYSLPITMRLLDVIGYPDMITPNMYRIKLVNAPSSVTPPENMDGIEVLMCAKTGFIIEFRFLCISIDVSYLGRVLSPTIVRTNILEENRSISSYLSEFSYMGEYLQFVKTNSYPENNITLQLGWTLRFNNSQDSPDIYEIHRDAFDGTRIQENPQDIRYGYYSEGDDTKLLVVPMVSILVATVVYLATRKKE